MALTLETMWSLRNKVVHNDGQMRPLVGLHSIQRMFKEHILAAQSKTSFDLLEGSTKWGDKIKC